MKETLIYLILSVSSLSLLAQERFEPIEYTKGDIEFRIIDTLYLPLDTTRTIRYQMINNSNETIEYGTPFMEEEFVAGKRWEMMKEPVPRETNDSVTVIRAFDMIGLNRLPGSQGEYSFSFDPVFKWFYEESKKYRIVKYFNFEGEEQRYYIWDELFVREQYK